jgi:hypothetical protein
MNYRIFESDVNNVKQEDFWRPKMSNESKPISNKHENYIFDKNANLFYQNNINNYFQPVNTRMENNGPVQGTFQTENFQNSFQNNYMNNYETINSNQEVNRFLERNPVNTRRDNMEKIRNADTNQFLTKQGGNLHNFTDFKIETTRKDRNMINTNTYIPMGKTMSIPKENL